MQLKYLIGGLATLVTLGLLLFISYANPFALNKKAGLQVITDPETTAVFLNGVYLDKTPLINRSLMPGEYLLRIEPVNDNLVAYETAITLTDGALTVVTWKPGETLEKSGGVIYEMSPIESDQHPVLRFTSVPEEAIIAVGDQQRTLSPAEFLDLPLGNIEYEITLPSYETQRHTLQLVPNYDLHVVAKLAKLEQEVEDDLN